MSKPTDTEQKKKHCCEVYQRILSFIYLSIVLLVVQGGYFYLMVYKLYMKEDFRAAASDSQREVNLSKSRLEVLPSVILVYIVTTLQFISLLRLNCSSFGSKLKAGEDNLNRCKECGTIKRPDIRHCHDCEVCIEGYDHHCGVVGVCIGDYNFKYFT